MAVTPQQRYLQEARTWIRRLDRGGGSGGRQLYVYRMEHGNAVDVARVLQSMFGTGEGGTATGGPSLAPGSDRQDIGTHRR
ncbi:MAG: hypothetical protein U5L11_00400 [Arhodomonas sp.]|nr:hypothetical protein [Arhodomonas sp.]